MAHCVWPEGVARSANWGPLKEDNSSVLKHLQVLQLYDDSKRDLGEVGSMPSAKYQQKDVILPVYAALMLAHKNRNFCAFYHESDCHSPRETKRLTCSNIERKQNSVETKKEHN